MSILKKWKILLKIVMRKLIVKINWTNAWGKKYPVLISYQNIVDIDYYSLKIREMLDKIKKDYQYNKLDSMLVLKDILYHEWKDN